MAELFIMLFYKTILLFKDNGLGELETKSLRGFLGTANTEQ